MAILDLIINAQKAKAGQRDFEQVTLKIGQAASNAVKSVFSLQSKIDAIAGAARRALNGLGGLLGGFTALLGVRQVVQTIAGFEKAMAELRAVNDDGTRSTKVLNKEMDLLGQVARNMGKTTSFAAEEAAKGMLLLSKAGLSTSEVIASIVPTLRFASGAELDLATASDILVNSLRQFGLQAVETGRVSDVLIKAANSSNIGVLDLAESFKVVGPTARALNLPIEDVAAALSVLGDNAIKGSSAGTNLSSIILTLLDPTKDQTKALKELNIQLDEVNPAKKGLIDIFQKFASVNIGAEQAVNAFQKRNVASALALSSSAERLKQLSEAFRNARGESDKLAISVAGTLSNKLEQLKSSFSEIALATGDAGFLGFLKTTLDGINLILRAIFGLQDAVLDIADMWSILKRYTADFWDWFTHQFELAALGFEAVFKKLLNTLLRLFADSLDGLSKTVDGLLNAVKKIPTTLQGYLLPVTVQDAFGSASNLAKSTSELVRNQANKNEADLLRQVIDSDKELDAKQQANFDVLINELGKTQTERARIKEELEKKIAAGQKAQVESAKGPDLKAAKALALAGQEGVSGLSEDDRIQQELKGRSKEIVSRTKLEIETMSLSNEERDKQIRLLEFEGVVRKTNEKDINAQVAAYDRLLTKLKTAERIRRIGDELGSAFSSAVDQIFDNLNDLDKAIEATLRSIQRAIFQSAVSKPIGEYVGNLISRIGIGIAGAYGASDSDSGSAQIDTGAGLEDFAKGGSFMVPFASGGGVIDRPTKFSMSGGRTGIAGEAGTEGAIFPLSRDGFGRLGIRAEGTTSPTQNIVYMTVKTPDANSFRKSKKQITADLRRGLGG